MKDIGFYKESTDHFLCNDCSVKSSNKNDYKLITRDDLKDNVYQCDGCGRKMSIEKKKKNTENIFISLNSLLGLLFGLGALIVMILGWIIGLVIFLYILRALIHFLIY
ncbi:MAG: hypothetical protein Q7T34_00480 [Candidatus Parcubacteria bacterium]|nr:hypothetical protein [Candidatus Parcubacteria bacterium]